MVGNQDPGQLYLIDFGFATRFRSAQRQHIPKQKIRTFRGNFLFSSINPVLSPNRVTSANLNVELRVRVNSSLAVYNIYQAQAQSVEMSGEDIDASERYLMTSPLTQKFDAECLLFPRHSSVSWVLPAGPRGALATNLVTHAKWLNTTRQLTSTSTSTESAWNLDFKSNTNNNLNLILKLNLNLNLNRNLDLEPRPNAEPLEALMSKHD